MSILDRVAPPPGAVLVRVLADGPEWLDHLPAVPGGDVVTASVSDVALRPTGPEQLADRGYRVVGVLQPRAPGTRTAVVDLLVEAAVAQRHPAWWRQLLEIADTAYDLRLGPVQRALGPQISLHVRG